MLMVGVTRGSWRSTALCLLAVSACAPPVEGALGLAPRWRDGTVWAARASRAALLLPSSVETLRIGVSGPDMDAVVREVAVEASGDATQVVRVDGIPAGDDRVATVEGLDAASWPVFHGTSEAVRIVAGGTAQAAVELIPSPGGEDEASGTPSLLLRLDGGAPRTGSSEVELNLEIGANTVEQVAFFAVEPTVACRDAEIAWAPLGPVPGFALAAVAAGAEADRSAWALARDPDGYCSKPVRGTIRVDRRGPTLSAATLLVTDAAPGAGDTVAAPAAAVTLGELDESATVAVYADVDLETLLDQVAVAADGSFPPLSLGDNGYDARLATPVWGQATYYVQARDDLGNPGAATPVTADVTPPPLAPTGLTATLGGTTWATLGAGALVTFTVTSDGPLAAAPTVDLPVAYIPPDCAGILAADPSCCGQRCNPPPPGGSACCDAHAACCSGEVPPAPSCGDFDTGANTYQCQLTVGDEGEEGPTTLTVTGVELGSANVGVASLPDLLVDLTPPGAPVAGAFTVDSQPPGADDTVSAAAGALEPSSTAVLYYVNRFTGGGPVCSNPVEIDRAVVDATGAVPLLTIGDNSASQVYVRAIDAAGNDRCPHEPTECSWSCPDAVELLNDTWGPTVEFAALPATTYGDVATFPLTVAEAGPSPSGGGPPSISEPVTLQCRVLPADFAPCTNPTALAVSASGLHTVEVRGVDAIGNAGAVVYHTWRVQPQTALARSQPGAIRDVAPAPGSEPLVVWRDDALGQLRLARFTGGAWTAPVVVQDDAVTAPCPGCVEWQQLAAAQSGDDLWLAAVLTDGGEDDVHVSHYALASGQLTRHGPVQPLAVNPAGQPQIAVLPSGAPIVLYVREEATYDAVVASWWSGAAFSAPTHLHEAVTGARNPRLLAAADGPGGAGLPLAAWIDEGIGHVLLVQLDPSSEDDGDTVCDSCVASADNIVTVAPGSPLHFDLLQPPGGGAPRLFVGGGGGGAAVDDLGFAAGWNSTALGVANTHMMEYDLTSGAWYEWAALGGAGMVTAPAATVDAAGTLRAVFTNVELGEHVFVRQVGADYWIYPVAAPGLAAARLHVVHTGTASAVLWVDVAATTLWAFGEEELQ